MDDIFKIALNTDTKFLLSTSGRQTSIVSNNEALSDIGINLVYFSFDHGISPKLLTDMVRAPIIRGAAVVGQGLKTSVIPYLDHVDPLAEAMKCVNTIVNDNGVISGYNTDAYGLKTAIEQGVEKAGVDIRTAVVYGNGGVSGVAYRVLEDLGYQVEMICRNPKNVMCKKKELGIDDREPISGPYDLVVDATPIAEYPNFMSEAVGFADLLEGTKMVFCHNMPEKKNRTNYLQKHCESNGIHFVPGRLMYSAQLIKQYALYFNGMKNIDGKSISENDIIKAWKL